MGSTNKAFWEDEVFPTESASTTRNEKRRENLEKKETEEPPLSTQMSETDGNQMVKSVS